MFSYSILNGFVVLLKMLFGFIITKYVAILGGPAAVAFLGQFQSLVTIFQNIPNGTSNGIIALTPLWNEKNKIKSLWFGSLVILICIFIFLLLSLFFSDELNEFIFSNENFNKYYFLLVVIYPFYHFYSLLNAINTSKENFTLYFKTNIISMLTYIIAMLILCFYFKFGDIYIWIMLFIPYCSIIIFIPTIYLNKKIIFSKEKIDYSAILYLAKFLLASIVSVVFTPLVIIIVRNLISSSLGDIIMGNWQAMWRMSEVYTSVIMLSISTIILPKFSNALTKKDIYRVFLDSLIFILPLYFCFSFLVLFKTDWVFTLLYSDDFLINNNALFLQLGGDFFKIGCWLFTYFLLSKSRLKLLIWLEVFFGFLFLLIIKILITNVGVLSVSISYLITQMFCFLFLSCYCYFYIKRN